MEQPSIEEQIAATRKLRLDYRTTVNLSAVWVPYRGKWCAAQVHVTRSKTYVNAAIEHCGTHLIRYTDLRARRPGLDGADVPLEPTRQTETV